MVDNISFCELNSNTYSKNHSSVKKLELQNQHVSWTLPVEIFYLPNLKVFDLSGNEGIFPDFRHLDLSSLGSLKKIFFQMVTPWLWKELTILLNTPSLPCHLLVTPWPVCVLFLPMFWDWYNYSNSTCSRLLKLNNIQISCYSHWPSIICSTAQSFAVPYTKWI